MSNLAGAVRVRPRVDTVVADFDDLYVLVDDFGAFALATASVML